MRKGAPEVKKPAKGKKDSKKLEAGKSIRELKAKLWPIFSKFIRLRDNYTCYTCGKMMLDNKSSCHAGHYVPQSKGNALRYDQRNVHAQCFVCNNMRRGNLYEYAIRLERDYGPGILQELDGIKKDLKKFARWELEEMIELYQGKVRDFEVCAIAEQSF